MRLCLRILNPPAGEANETYSLDPPGGLLGRGTDNVVCLPYDSVSRQHAELRYEGQKWWIYQRSQTSLTLLDEEVVAANAVPRQLLPSGSLKLGRVALSYWQEAVVALPAAPNLTSEATLILPRRMVPLAISPAMLAQMSPVRVAESAAATVPETLIRRPVGAAPPSSPPMSVAAPETLIRRPAGAAPPPLPPQVMSGQSETPETLISRPGRVVASATAAQAQPKPHSLPIVEHRPPVTSTAKPEPQLDSERENLRSLRDRLAAEVERLKRENEGLRDARAALVAQLAAQQAAAPPPPETPPASLPLFREKAMELLQPFGRSIEQAGAALGQGDTTLARSLLRAASFALADLRDLFQS